MNFKDRRKELNLTLEEVGKMCEVGKSTVLKWERGDIANMKRDKIALYAKALRISPIEVLDPKNELGDNYVDINKVFNKLNFSNKQKTYNYAKRKYNEQSNGKVIALPNAEVVNVVPVHDIQVYDNPVSAGFGEDLLSGHHESVEYKGHLPKNYDAALRISGDSMEPVYHDGEIIFVKMDKEAYDGQVVIASLNDKAYIKKLKINGKHFRLISYNKAYQPIEVKDGDEFKVLGTVLN